MTAIPWRYLVIAALLYAAGWVTNGWRLGVELAQMERNAANGVAAAVEQARNIERDHVASLVEVQENAKRSIDSARSDGAAADSAAERLRQRADTLADSCNPRPAPGSPSTADAAQLLAVMLRRADTRAGELAKLADEARARGLACELAYDSIRSRQNAATAGSN